MMAKSAKAAASTPRLTGPSPSFLEKYMKILTLRTCVALACAFALASCGGGSNTLFLGGSIIGLTKPGLTLQNGSGTPLAIEANQAQFSFPQLLKSDEAFEVKIATQPTGAKCSVSNGKGTTGSFDISSVLVTCITDTYNLGGTITGTLDVNGLVLANGIETKAIKAGAKTFTMSAQKDDGTPLVNANGFVSGKVADGAPYGITIYQQPLPRFCTVSNGVGTMPSSDLNTVVINCN
jgi:hypothetical protein